jgi:hypothetical protein
MGKLEEALNLVRSSASLEYTSHLGLSLVLKVEFAFTRNSKLCLAFLRRCSDYRDFVVAPATSPTSSRVVASHDLCERAMRPPFETTSAAAENADDVKGLSL